MDNNGFSPPNNSKKGLSAAEFQRNLYNWFESRGLLDELRTQLRHQMVVALKNTSLGPGSSKHSNKLISPKTQAINLLIAEFLLQHEHHYTLSVFTSEVPLLRTLPEFTLSGTQVSGGSTATTTDESAPRFHQHDVKDILESFGLPLESEIGNRIYAQYQESKKGTALLTCILQNVSERKMNKTASNAAHRGSDEPVQESRSKTSVKSATNSEKESRSIKKLKELYKVEMQEIIYQSQLKSQHIKQLQEEIRRFQESEVEKIRMEEEAKFHKELKKREADIQADFNNREEEISRKLKEAENKIAKQRQTLDSEVKKKRQDISVLSAQLQEQHVQMSHKMHEMEEQAEHLEREEKRIEEIKQKDSLELAERTSVLDIRQQQLQQEFERLNAERETMSFVQLQLEDSRRQLIQATQSLAHSQSEVSFLRNIQQQCSHLRYELDATRHKLDNLTELQFQKSSEVLAPECKVKMIDKQLQTAIQQNADTRRMATQTLSESQDKSTDMDILQSEQELQQYHYLTEMVRQLQGENEELRGHTQQQRLRIDELTSHASDLANQLEDAQTAITLLSNHPAHEEPRLLRPVFLSPGPGTITVPPLTAPPPETLPPPPPPLPTHSPDHSYQVGAGEQLNYVTPPQTLQQPPLSSSGHSNFRECRKKPPRRLMVHSNSDSSNDTSPTEEILQEARRRLRKLEEESEAVDRSYQNFRRRHENLAPTTSLLFHSMLPPHLQYNSSSFGYGSYTSSQPLYSSAVGGNNTSVFSNLNYDSRPTSRHNDALLNPLISNTTSRVFPSVYDIGRMSSAVPYTVGNSTQYRSQPIGNVTSQSRYPGLNNTGLSHSRFMREPTESRFNLLSQPSTSTGHPRSTILQPKDKTDSHRIRLERENTSSPVNMVDAFPECHSQHHHQTKTVMFGSPLKTTMVYTSPQVSSIESSARQSDSNSAFITVQSYTSSRPITSTVQSSPRSENITSEVDRIPHMASRLEDNITSSFQHFPGREMPDNDETSLSHRLSTDNIWQLRYKLSSYFNPTLEHEIPIKDSVAVNKDIADPSNDSEGSSVKKLFLATISDSSKSFTALNEDQHPSGSFVLSDNIDGGSIDNHVHPICNVSSNTFSSSIKDPSLGSMSTDRESLIQPDVVNDKEPDIASTHDESEISGTHTLTTVKHKKEGTSESSKSLVRDSQRNLVPSDQSELKKHSSEDNELNISERKLSENIFKDSQNTKPVLLSSVTEDTRNERLITEPSKDTEDTRNERLITEPSKDTEDTRNERLITEPSKDIELPVFIAELEITLHDEERVTKNGETSEAIVDLENLVDSDPKVSASSKAEKRKSESLTEEESDVAISIGDQSKMDDSSKDDFW